MSNKQVFFRWGLTGGAATSLDAIDGANLVDGQPAFVAYNGKIHFFIVDEDSGAAESPPDVVAPDTNAGNKRWIRLAACDVPAVQALRALTPAPNKLPYYTGADSAALADLTTLARSLLAAADQSAARSAIGLEIGSNVQAYHAILAALAGLSPEANKLAYFTGAEAMALADLTYPARTLLATNLGGFGQCRLEYTSATTVTLFPRNGNLVPVKTAGGLAMREIPSTGVAGTTSGLSADTTYLVYLYDDAGDLKLGFEPIATGHSADTDTGVEIITGSATKTLVGMVRTDATPEFSEHLVATWFNRRQVRHVVPFTASAETASGTEVDLGAIYHAYFLSWGDGAGISACGNFKLSSAAATAYLGIAIDGAVAGSNSSFRWSADTTNYWRVIQLSYGGADPAEGYRYATLTGYTTAGATLTAEGSASTFRTAVSVVTNI